jgi:hypothetical protein
MKTINKKIFTSVLIICAAVIFCGKINAQSINILEEKLSRMSSSLSIEEIKLDSLKHIFKQQTEKINIEKSREVIDKHLVTELMSASLTIDERITEQSAIVNTLKNEIEQTKNLLSNKFESAVDSLSIKLTTAPESVQKIIEQEILNYNQKLVLLSPIVSNLAFNPTEILKLDPKKVSDPTERTIINEYLSSALSEVNNQLAVVSDQLNEINRTAELQQRAEEFIEDVKMDNNISNIRSSRSDDRVYSASFGGRDELSVNINKLVPQALVYSSILMQLNNLSIDGNETKRWTYDSLQTNLSIDSYINLLHDVKNGLTGYKKILESKLNFK